MDESVDYGEELPPGMAELDMELEKLGSDSLDVGSMSNRSRNSSLDFDNKHREDVTQKSAEYDRNRSGKSVKKAATSQKSGEKIIRSRAPPKKPYEPAPFLSIDNIPLDRKPEEKDSAQDGKASPKVPVNTPAGLYSFSQSKNGSGITQSLSSSDWNRMVPKKHKSVSAKAKQVVANGHVRSPFKHKQNKPPEKDHVVLPDQKMKEDTAAATYQVAKIIARQNPETEKKIPGRLLKARLKPLNTVNVTGPTINHCRGIVSETRSYTPSPNRTLQRRRYILNNLNRDFLYERPQTAESIHHTSVASDTTEIKDLDFKEGLHDPEIHGETIPEDHEGQDNRRSPSIGVASASAAQSDDDGNKQHPSTENMNDATEEDPDRQFLDQQADYLQNIKDLESCNEVAGQKADELTGPAGFRRPRSVQSGGSRKSVRFVEEQKATSKEELDTSRIGSRQDQTKDDEEGTTKNHRVTCRPYSSGPGNDNEDDNNEDQKRLENPRGYVMPGASNKGQRSSGTDQTHEMQKEGGEATEEAESPIIRTSISGIKFGSEDDDSLSHRPPSRGTRPRSRLGFWEDISKPDGDVAHLMVSGQGQNFSTKDEENQCQHDIRTAGVPFVKNKRPQSAKGPRPPQSKCPSQNTRPQSARNVTLNPDVSMSMNTATLNHRPQFTKSAVTKPAPPKASKQNMKRPQSAVSGRVKVSSINQSRPQSAKAQFPNSSQSRNISVLSRKTGHLSSAKTKRRPLSAKNKKNVRVQFGPATVVPGSGGQDCSYCGKKTQSNIDFKSGNYFVFCDPCREQSDPQRSSAQTSQAPEQGAQEVFEYQADESVLLEELGNAPQLENFDVSDYEDDTNYVDEEGEDAELAKLIEWAEQEPEEISTQNTSLPCTEPTASETEVDVASNPASQDRLRMQNGRGGTGGAMEQIVNENSLLLSLDVIEKSLDEVQNEIKECLIKAQADTAATDTLGGATFQAGPDSSVQSGEMSTKLIGDKDHKWEAIEHNVKVYQYVEPDAKIHNTCAGEVNQTEQEQREEENQTTIAAGDISTYDVTLMSPLQHVGQQQLVEQPKATREKPLEVFTEHKPSTESRITDEALEVRATALHKPRMDPESSQELGNAPIAPCAPLCFRVNARPPQGYLYYFAYGMDMNPDRLGTYIHRDIEERFWGLLFGFRLLFNKKGVDEEAGAFPNLELQSDSSVEGCLYLISPKELCLMDKTMGYPEHYEHVVLPVWLLNCPDAEELGMAQYCVAAVMYIAKDKWIHRGPKPLDCEYSVEQSLKGSNILSPAYISQLRSHTE